MQKIGNILSFKHYLQILLFPNSKVRQLAEVLKNCNHLKEGRCEDQDVKNGDTVALIY